MARQSRGIAAPADKKRKKRAPTLSESRFDPRHPRFRTEQEKQEKTWIRHFVYEMGLARNRWLGGDLTGFVEALWLCRRNNQPPPEWVVDVGELLVQRGATEDEKRAYRDWDLHFTRWELVTEYKRDHCGTSLERCYFEVSELLKKTDAAGKRDAIERSYELVKKLGGDDATFEGYLRHHRTGSPHTKSTRSK